ncbi:MAG: small ribosomal subunit Rsm22 family protein [Anaeromyxobacteraceae bacterium]
MPAPDADLARWIPRLLAAWRAASGAPARQDPGRDRRDRRNRRPEPQGRFGTRPPSSLRPPADTLLPDELRQVAAAVEKLSRGLTRERQLAGARYMDDARLLGAYLLFYWPVSYLQARGVLSELPTKPRSVLDLGSGPGPVGLAALDAGAAEVLLADRSAKALDAARALAVAAGEPVATRVWTPGQPLAALAQGRRVDVVTMGHLLNELFQELPPAEADRRRAALVEEALALVAPGGTVLVVEPALRDTSRALLRVRDLLVAKGFAVRAPCLFRGACPALLKETDWCHAERPVEPPPVVAQIAKAAGLRREAVKMSYLAVAAPGEAWAPPPPGRVFRIVSEPLPSKGRLRYMGCGPEGRMGLALQERHVTDANRRFEGLLRGDVVALGEAEARGDGLALGERSSVEVIAAAGAALPGGGLP